MKNSFFSTILVVTFLFGGLSANAQVRVKTNTNNNNKKVVVKKDRSNYYNNRSRVRVKNNRNRIKPSFPKYLFILSLSQWT